MWAIKETLSKWDTWSKNYITRLPLPLFKSFSQRFDWKKASANRNFAIGFVRFVGITMICHFMISENSITPSSKSNRLCLFVSNDETVLNVKYQKLLHSGINPTPFATSAMETFLPIPPQVKNSKRF